jgi:hypothetical protein
MREHTPLPWTIERTKDHGAAYRIMDEQEVTVALCYQQPYDTWRAKDNAAFIVRAVNNHAALVAALEAAADYMGEMGHPEGVLAQARAVLAKAKL